MEKTIVITGGSDGFGRVLAERLASTNKVVIISPDLKKLSLTAKQIGCDFAVADVSDATQVKNSFAKILKKYKKIDCLVNNAGIWIEGPVEKNDPKLVQKVLAVNAGGAIICSQAVIPMMKKQKRGLIINLISQAGLHSRSDRSVYCSSKWAVTGFTKSLAQELEPFGIRVTGIYPGKMRTNLFKNAGLKKNMSDAIDAGKVAQAVEFVISLDDQTVIPELGIKLIGQ